MTRRGNAAEYGDHGPIILADDLEIGTIQAPGD
jgi:hypothetical protein